MVVLGAAWGDVACIFGEGDVCIDPFRACDLTARTGTDLLPCFFLSVTSVHEHLLHDDVMPLVFIQCSYVMFLLYI